MLLATAALFAIQVPAASAQQAQPGGLEEILVTSTKTGATRLQETPAAITAFTGDFIAKSGIRDIRDLIQATPNVAMSENTGFAQLFIRGVGSNNIFAGSDPSSTIHVDGVYLARPASYISSFMDVERIEVLRGPQGTLYGRNSTGGTVNVISRKPGDELRGAVQVDLGDYDLRRFQAYVSSPISDRVSASLAVLESTRGAYRKNIIASGNDLDDDRTMGARAQLRVRPSEALDITLRGEWLKERPHVMGYSKILEPRGSAGDVVLGDFSKVALNFPNYGNRGITGNSIDIDYDFGGAKLKSLTSFRTSRYSAQIDSDASDLDLLRTILPESQHQLSSELNLTGTFLGAKYVLGAYYFTETIHYPLRVITISTNTEARSNPHIYTTSWAGYGQATIPITDTLSATGGARYTYELKKFDQDAGPYSFITGALTGVRTRYSRVGNYYAFTPKFGLEWKAQPDLMLYGSVTRGFKSGGFVNSSTDPNQGFAPEKLWSYEIGLKSELLDRRLRLNAAAFYYDYSDLQVNFFLRPGVTDIRNAATATVKGGELELESSLNGGWELSASVALLDATYDNFAGAPLRGNVGSFNAAGKNLNDSPPVQLRLAAQKNFSLPGDWSGFVRGEGVMTGQMYFTPENNKFEGQGEYWLMNYSIGATSPSGQFSLLAMVRNATDVQYVTGTASFAVSRVAARPGAPRTFQVQGSYHF